MRLSFKIILIIWALLLAILAGVVYTAYSRLHPDALVGLMREEVRRNYPDTELKVGSLQYSFALDFKLDLTNILVERKGRRIGSIREIEVKIPWWLFLSDKGSVQVNVSDLELFIDPPKMPKESAAPDRNEKKSVSVRASVPSYLAKAKYTFRAKNIVIMDLGDSHRYLSVTKLLLRDFQYGKNSAFEVTLPIEVNHNAAKFNSELWLFGDVTPGPERWTMNYWGEFKTKDVADRLQFDDVNLDGKAEFRPKGSLLNSDLNFLISKQNVGGGKLSVDPEKLLINLNFSRFPLSYLAIISEEIKNPFLPVLEGQGEGELRMEKRQDTGATTLNSKVSFDGIMGISEDMVYAGKWVLSFEDSKWESSFITPNGEVSFFRRSIVDFDSGTVVQYNEEIGFSGINVHKAMGRIPSFEQFRTESGAGFYSSTASFKQCIEGEQKIDGEVRMGRTPETTFYVISLLENGKGKFDLNYEDKNAVEQVALDATDFRWAGYPLLAPFFTAETGQLGGKLQGKWRHKDWAAGEWKGDLVLKGLTKAEGKLPVFWLKSIAPFETQPVLTDLTWSFESRNKKLNLKSLSFDGATPGRVTGSLTADGIGTLTYSNPKNKKLRSVKKDLTQLTL